MRKPFFFFLLLLTLSALFSSCSVYTYYIEDSAQAFPSTNPAEIKIYTTDINQPYKVIGSVAIATEGSTQAAKDRLKKNAAKIGADAIIFCKLTKMTSFDSTTGLSGVAIRLETN